MARRRSKQVDENQGKVPGGGPAGRVATEVDPPVRPRCQNEDCEGHGREVLRVAYTTLMPEHGLRQVCLSCPICGHRHYYREGLGREKSEG